MEKTKLHLLLADDDIDDCDFFQDAINELSVPPSLSIVHNGVELMEFLIKNSANPPHLIFLDLNMPKKSGLECMAKIKSSDSLSHIPIIIYSTSLDPMVVNSLYQMGAHHYIQKPANFASIKSVIQKAIALYNHPKLQTPARETFIIEP